MNHQIAKHFATAHRHRLASSSAASWDWEQFYARVVESLERCHWHAQQREVRFDYCPICCCRTDAVTLIDDDTYGGIMTVPFCSCCQRAGNRFALRNYIAVAMALGIEFPRHLAPSNPVCTRPTRQRHACINITTNQEGIYQ